LRDARLHVIDVEFPQQRGGVSRARIAGGAIYALGSLDVTGCRLSASSAIPVERRRLA
jgi:hypothetical protein